MQGSYTALITPFNEDFSLNEEKFIELIQRQIDGGTDGLLPCGTTGETPALTVEEKYRIISLAVTHKAPFQKVLAGSGTNNTEKTIEETKKIAALGVDYALVITPYYNKPNQEGLYRHFSEVLDASPIPVVLYNVPGRTGVNILPKTVARLAKHEKLVAVKEASGNVVQAANLESACGNDLSILSGDDPLTLPLMSVGVKGVISVTANVAPDKVKKLTEYVLTGDCPGALILHRELLKLNQHLFLESNPIPVKVAMNLMGLNVGPVRLPLGPASSETVNTLKTTLAELNLI
jgi:4-hydroxy-tetrahydrodipicolinate synthase